MNTDITVLELRAALAAGASVVDVREPYEWTSEHIAGAIHIPLASLPVSLDQLPDGEFFVICHVGARSAMAVRWLRGQGHAARNVAGGMQDWVVAGLPIQVATN